MARKPAGRKTPTRRTPTKGTEKGTGASYAAPTMGYASFGAGSSAYLKPGDPGYAPTPATDTVRLRKGGYTKVDGKLYKGTYAGVNNAPYATGVGPTPWAGLGGGGKTALFTGPQGAASAYSDPKLFKKYIKQAEALGYGSGNYSQGGLGRGGKKGKGKGKGGGRDQGYAGGSGGAGLLDAEALAAEVAGQSVYAEADTSTTSYLGAQGKAYKRGRGEGLMGQTYAAPQGASTVVEDAAAGGGGRRRHPGRKATRKAKAKTSPGGRRVTTKERARIRKAKGK